MKLGFMLIVMLVASGVSAGAQSLGEMAQKEKEKREARAKEGSAKSAKKDGKAAEGKVYTADDLAGYAEKEAKPFRIRIGRCRGRCAAALLGVVGRRRGAPDPGGVRGAAGG